MMSGNRMSDTSKIWSRSTRQKMYVSMSLSINVMSAEAPEYCWAQRAVVMSFTGFGTTIDTSASSHGPRKSSSPARCGGGASASNWKQEDQMVENPRQVTLQTHRIYQLAYLKKDRTDDVTPLGASAGSQPLASLALGAKSCPSHTRLR